MAVSVVRFGGLLLTRFLSDSCCGSFVMTSFAFYLIAVVTATLAAAAAAEATRLAHGTLPRTEMKIDEINPSQEAARRLEIVNERRP